MRGVSDTGCCGVLALACWDLNIVSVRDSELGGWGGGGGRQLSWTIIYYS
jgi:hypothetical protein